MLNLTDNTRGVVEKEAKLGETLTGHADGNTEPSRNHLIPGVRNEQMASSKEMVCSDLAGNRKIVAEMTTDR